MLWCFGFSSFFVLAYALGSDVGGVNSIGTDITSFGLVDGPRRRRVLPRSWGDTQRIPRNSDERQSTCIVSGHSSPPNVHMDAHRELLPYFRT